MSKFLKFLCFTGPVALVLALFCALAPAPQPVAAADPATDVVAYVNYERARYGLAPLQINYQLTNAAQSYARVMANYGCFSHYCWPVPSPDQRARLAGYRGRTYVGENIAYGAYTAQSVFWMWMRSPAHRASILSPYYTQIGVGLAWRGNTPYWVQNFA